jgi:hypothetical protein
LKIPLRNFFNFFEISLSTGRSHQARTGFHGLSQAIFHLTGAFVHHFLLVFQPGDLLVDTGDVGQLKKRLDEGVSSDD